jgi:hypothetical protein
MVEELRRIKTDTRAIEVMVSGYKPRHCCRLHDLMWLLRVGGARRRQAQKAGRSQLGCLTGSDTRRMWDEAIRGAM